ncbi:hypothetical protein LOCC1_G005908 [Lachnellula occidentalis]|uniref:Uncharacterized protein n=1 Tax=Lachnellula occidentalis TaxID=215460 RepID=A0A8H8S3T0_9HELO|nr:hypothetical protein LOCC1_G005908 [Lachnellula occidentalis]
MTEASKIALENTCLHKRTANCNGSAPEDFDVSEILQASVEKDIIPQHLEDARIERQRQTRVSYVMVTIPRKRPRFVLNPPKRASTLQTAQKNLHVPSSSRPLSLGTTRLSTPPKRRGSKTKLPLSNIACVLFFGYRNLYGIRAEWQASAVPGKNGGKRPFEPSELDVSDFAVIHTLFGKPQTPSTTIKTEAVVGRTQDDEDGKRHGVKNMVHGNQMNLNSDQGRPYYYIHPSEVEAFTPVADACRFIGTAIHELIGYGTGKLLIETGPGKFNFDHKDRQ